MEFRLSDGEDSLPPPPDEDFEVSKEDIDKAIAAAEGLGDVVGDFQEEEQRPDEGKQEEDDKNDVDAEKQEQQQEEDAVIRVACKARGIKNHNADNAFLEIPRNAPHGLILVCCHPECSNSTRRFRYCAVCKEPVTKRNFTMRHNHDLLKNVNGRFIFPCDEEAQMAPPNDSSSSSHHEVSGYEAATPYPPHPYETVGHPVGPLFSFNDSILLDERSPLEDIAADDVISDQGSLSETSLLSASETDLLTNSITSKLAASVTSQNSSGCDSKTSPEATKTSSSSTVDSTVVIMSNSESCSDATSNPVKPETMMEKSTAVNRQDLLTRPNSMSASSSSLCPSKKRLRSLSPEEISNGSKNEVGLVEHKEDCLLPTPGTFSSTPSPSPSGGDRGLARTVSASTSVTSLETSSPDARKDEISDPIHEFLTNASSKEESQANNIYNLANADDSQEKVESDIVMEMKTTSKKINANPPSQADDEQCSFSSSSSSCAATSTASRTVPSKQGLNPRAMATVVTPKSLRTPSFSGVLQGTSCMMQLQRRSLPLTSSMSSLSSASSDQFLGSALKSTSFSAAANTMRKSTPELLTDESRVLGLRESRILGVSSPFSASSSTLDHVAHRHHRLHHDQLLQLEGMTEAAGGLSPLLSRYHHPDHSVNLFVSSSSSSGASSTGGRRRGGEEPSSLFELQMKRFVEKWC